MSFQLLEGSLVNNQYMIAYKISMIFHPLILHSPVQIYDISHTSFLIIKKVVNRQNICR